MKKIVTILLLTASGLGYSQNYQDQGKLVASDRKALTELGASVDVSGDYAVVGSVKEYMNVVGTDSMVNAGAVYIFEKQANDSWLEVQKIVNSDRTIHDQFGRDLALDGTTLIVGAPGQDFDENGLNNIPATGAAYVYDRQTSGVWTLTQKIVCNTRQITAQIGKIVDLSGDYLLIGSYNDYTDESYMNTLSNTGAIYMFKKNLVGVWQETEKIVASDRATHEWFAIESHLNGDKLIVGAEGTNHAGKAYVYQLDVLSGLWSEQDILSASDVTNGDQFAHCVSINDNYAVVGAPREGEDELGANTISNAGAIYVYELNGTTGNYDSLQKIAMPDRLTYSTTAFFGNDIEITSDNLLYVGAFSSTYSATSSGAAYRFDLAQSGNFEFDEKFGAVDGVSSDMVGEYLAVSGKTIILSTRANDSDANGNNALTDGGGAFIVKACKTTASITIDACEEYLLPSGGNYITTSGIYEDIIPNSEGCDSVISLDVSIHTLPVSTTTQIDDITFSSDEIEPTSTYQWVDCDDNYSHLAGEINSEFSASFNGNFAVIVTNIGTCSDTSACVNVNSVNLSELNPEVSLRLFPNPTNGSFTLSGLDLNSINEIRIYHLNGMIAYDLPNIQSSDSIFLDINLPKGVYVVEVSNEQRIERIRFVRH